MRCLISGGMGKEFGRKSIYQRIDMSQVLDDIHETSNLLVILSVRLSSRIPRVSIAIPIYEVAISDLATTSTRIVQVRFSIG